MRRGLLLLLAGGCGLARTPPGATPTVATVTYVDLPAGGAPPAAAGDPLRLPLPIDAPCSRGFSIDERHHALDLVAPPGTPVLASAAGLVVRASRHRDYGLVVILEHAAGIYTLYAHLASLAVTAGEHVEAGGRLGDVGDTGNARGVHLHWEVLRAEGPLPLRADGPLGIAAGEHRVDPAAMVAGVPASCQRSISPTVDSSSDEPSGMAPSSRSAAFSASRSSDERGP